MSNIIKQTLVTKLEELEIEYDSKQESLKNLYGEKVINFLYQNKKVDKEIINRVIISTPCVYNKEDLLNPWFIIKR